MLFISINSTSWVQRVLPEPKRKVDINEGIAPNLDCCLPNLREVLPTNTQLFSTIFIPSFKNVQGHKVIVSGGCHSDGRLAITEIGYSVVGN